MDKISNPSDQEEPQQEQQKIVEENKSIDNKQNINDEIEINDKDIQNDKMISISHLNHNDETVESSQIQIQNKLKNEEIQQEEEKKQQDQNNMDGQQLTNNIEQIISDGNNEINNQLEIKQLGQELVQNNDKCKIHDIRNKYVCVQQNCSALSRIACAECHVEGPHPKHELVKIEQFKDIVSAKSQKAMDTFKQINKESAKKTISEIIQKLQDDFINQLQEYKQEKMNEIDNCNLIGDEILQNNKGQNSEINYDEILPHFANQNISFQDTSLINLAILLYNQEQNDSIEVSKANFALFIEDIQKDINQIEKNIQRAFVDKINAYDQILDQQNDIINKSSRPEGINNQNQVNSGVEIQHDIEENNRNITENNVNIGINQMNNVNDRIINKSIQSKRNLSSIYQQNYNWRDRREEQRQEEEKLMHQEGNNKQLLIRKTAQLKLKGQKINKVLDHKGWVCRIERLADNIFASCSSDKTVLIWDINTMKPIKTWKHDSTTKNHIISLCKLDNSTLAMGGSDKLIRIFQWETETMIKILKGHKGGVNYIIPLNEEVIASCGSDNSIVVWNWKQDIVLNNLSNFHSQAIYQICILHSNSFLASCSKDSTVKVYNFDKKEVVATLHGAKQAVHTICYLKKTFLAAGSADQTIRIWNYVQQIQTKVIRVPNQSIYTLCRIDDHYLASGQSDNKIKIWAYEEGETLENSQDSRHGYGALCVKTLDGHTSAVSCLNYFPEKFQLISGSNDHSICLWN